MTTSTHTALENVIEQTSVLDWVTNNVQLRRLSKDFSWFSPVLKDELEACQAEAAVRPRSVEELSTVISHCVKEQIALTVRGGGSGNYGQAVPLKGGVIIDMSRLNALLHLRNGIAQAQAGIRLMELEKATHPMGYELRCMPSTFRMATLGGFLCGGFGGVGSINYGPLGANGTVLGIRIMTIEEEPRILELDAEQARHIAHAYGTNGIVLDIRMALAPAQSWTEQLVTFPSQKQALDFAFEIAHSPGINKRELAYFEPGVLRFFTPINGEASETDHAVILSADLQSLPTVGALRETHGGTLRIQQGADISTHYANSLIEYCWNHTTLHALSYDSAQTYLQLMFPVGKERQAIDLMTKEFGTEVMQHIEFLRGDDGNIFLAGLPIVKFTTKERLADIIARHRELGIQVNDPHTYELEMGKHAGNFDLDMLEIKRSNDPKGLLNPGKMKSFDAIEA